MTLLLMKRMTSWTRLALSRNKHFSTFKAIKFFYFITGRHQKLHSHLSSSDGVAMPFAAQSSSYFRKTSHSGPCHLSRTSNKSDHTCAIKHFRGQIFASPPFHPYAKWRKGRVSRADAYETRESLLWCYILDLEYYIFRVSCISRYYGIFRYFCLPTKITLFLYPTRCNAFVYFLFNILMARFEYSSQSKPTNFKALKRLPKIHFKLLLATELR